MAKIGRPRQFDRDIALRQAMALFWEHGYESTSMAQLKQAMGGISAASLYAAFGSKEALYRETVELYMETEGRRLREQLENPDAEPWEAIRNALRSAVRREPGETHPAGCMVVLSATNCAPENSHLQAAMAQERTRTRQAFRDRLQHGVEHGHIPPHTDIDTLAALLSTLLNGLSIQARDGLNPDTLDAVIDTTLASLK